MYTFNSHEKFRSRCWVVSRPFVNQQLQQKQQKRWENIDIVDKHRYRSITFALQGSARTISDSIASIFESVSAREGAINDDIFKETFF